jgi:hypothetical protein
MFSGINPIFTFLNSQLINALLIKVKSGGSTANTGIVWKMGKQISLALSDFSKLLNKFARLTKIMIDF